MKILIIGSKGFIGSHVLRHFNDAGYETSGCDVIVEYNDPNYFQVDATNASYEEIFSTYSFDVVINCSGAASVPDSFVHPMRDFYLNVQIVYTILDSLRKHNPGCRFVHLSSAAVYGNPAKLPVAESAPLNPLSPYGLHKHYGEKICDEFHRHFNVPTCSVRIFSAYGPGLRKQIFWDWFQKMSRTGKINLIGTGEESRDFIFVHDITRALECIVKRGAFEAEIINVANGQEIFIRSAIELFKKASGLNFVYDFNNEVRKGDPINWAADITNLKSLGYEQMVGFEDGIKQYLQWLQEEK
jgi:UDP-glucose 4-epimerase